MVCLKLSSSWHIGYHYSMGDWYRFVKTIKGHSYFYEQQTYRDGGRVQTRNRYIGPAGGDTVGVSLPGGPSAVTTTSLVRGVTSFGKAMFDQFGGVEAWGQTAINQLGMSDAKPKRTRKSQTVTTTVSRRHKILAGYWEGQRCYFIGKESKYAT